MSIVVRGYLSGLLVTRGFAPAEAAEEPMYTLLAAARGTVALSSAGAGTRTLTAAPRGTLTLEARHGS